MKLLEAEQVKEEKKQSDQDRIKRVAKLNYEETESVKRINLLHERERYEKQRLAEELEPGQKRLQVKKTVLSLEVDALEARKKEALKPVEELREQADRALKDNEEYQKTLINRDKILRGKEETLVERVEEVSDREDGVEILESNLKVREKGIVGAESEIKRSSNALAIQWVEYHKESTAKISEIEMREREVRAGKKSNEDFRSTLDNRESNLMKPVEVKMQKAEKAIEENKIISIKLKQQQDEVSQQETIIAKRDTESKNKSLNLDSREKLVVKDEESIKTLRADIKIKGELLEKNTKKKLEVIDVANRILIERENKVMSGEKTNERFRVQLLKMQKEYSDASQLLRVKEGILVEREMAIFKKENATKATLHSIEILKKEVITKLEDIDLRINKLSAQEKNVKKIADEIEEKRKKFEKELSDRITKVSKREKEVEDGRRINEEFKKSLDRVTVEQKEKDRQIGDRYRTLGRAIEEAKKNHNIKITL